MFGGAIEILYDRVAIIASTRDSSIRKSFLDEITKLVEH